MPTSATVPLKNLVEPRVRDSLKKSLLNGGQEDPKPDPDPDPNPRSGRPRHLYISPPLYATPEQAPVPEYSLPDPLSPSPYVLNHKRGNETRKVGAGEALELPSGDEVCGFSLEGENFVNEGLDANDDDDDDDDEGFLDPRCESMSVGSEVGENDFLVGRQVDSHSIASGQGEFFYANDGFSSDGSVSNLPSCSSRIESELHATRLSILEEIERRKSAEEAFFFMRSQYERMSDLMSQAGLTFPSFPSAMDNMELENDSIDQFSQEIYVARFVAEAVGRGLARAEAEGAAATIIESKDQEILRLQNRLQYCETVNHELSQRKLVEVARRQQERKRSRRRWIWSFMGLSIAMGASFFAYSYIPHPSKYLSSQKLPDLTGTS